MLRMEEWVDIVAAHHRGVSIKEIARQTGLSRNTVRRAIRSEHVPAYVRAAMPSKFDPYKDYLIGRLDEFPRLSVEKLFSEIRGRGYDGGKTILAEFTRPYRQARRRNSDIRFETPPGKQAQVDWAELGIREVAGERVRLSLFLMVLGYSRMLYAELVTDETQETFIACHEHAFAFFGGMPEEILYDNAKVVALKHDREGVVFNPALLDFAGRCGFEPKACRPYRPQTKGKVERSVRYVRDSFLEGERFSSLEDMADKLAAWLDNVANVRIHATTKERPIDLLLNEGLNDFRPGFKPSFEPQTRIVRLASRDFSFVESPEVENRPLSVYEAAVG